MGAPVAAHEDGPELVRFARGAAVMLLVALLLGALMGLAFTRLQAIYVPLVTPFVIGFAVGLPIAGVRMHFDVRPRLPAICAAAFGGLLAFGMYQLLVYVQITGFLADNLPGLLERAVARPDRELQAFLEGQTGHQGLLAYFAFVSEGMGAELSPLGFVGRQEPGLGVTLALLAVDAVAAAGATVFFTLLRSRPLDLPPEPPPARPGRQVREVIARTDTDTLLAALQSMERGDFEAAGRVLRNPSAEDRHALAIIHDPDTDADWTLEVIDFEADGSPRVRSRRQLSSWDGQALWDELRVRG